MQELINIIEYNTEKLDHFRVYELEIEHEEKNAEMMYRKLLKITKPLGYKESELELLIFKAVYLHFRETDDPLAEQGLRGFSQAISELENKCRIIPIEHSHKLIKKYYEYKLGYRTVTAKSLSIRLDYISVNTT